MPETELGAADAALTTALADVKTAEAAAPADPVAVVDAVRAQTIPGSPIAQNAGALAHLDLVFIPALIAALKGA